MTLGYLRDLIRSAPPLAPDDPAAKAIRLLRTRGLPALPVADAGRLVGLLHEADITALAAGAPDPAAAAASVRVRQLMRPITLIARHDQDLASIAELFQERRAGSAPVIANDGRYLGMVLRRDLVAALVGQPPIPAIAGLATPFGVHLTTGRHRAGRGDLALGMTGVVLMAANLLAYGIIYGLVKLAEHWLPALLAAQMGSSAALGMGGWLAVLQMLLFLVLLRLSPLTGVHAAEHMVVHAIEEGEDLTLEKVRAMPRVHARCGTNLMALLVLIGMGGQVLVSNASAAAGGSWLLAFLLIVVVILLTWRRLGSSLQRWVTTRGPSDGQLLAAIKVGEVLLARVQAQPGARASAARRIWNTGFVQVLLGFALVFALVEYGAPWLVEVWSRLR